MSTSLEVSLPVTRTAAINGTLPADGQSAASAGRSSKGMPSVADDEFNLSLIRHMQTILEHGQRQSDLLYVRLKWSYRVAMSLTVAMFVVGLVLITAPIWGPLVAPQLDWQSTLVVAGLGAVELISLLLFNPLARIQKLMGDISQLILVLDGFHIRVALRLVESDLSDRPTVGAAADHVEVVTESTLKLVEEYFEGWLGSDLKRAQKEGRP